MPNKENIIGKGNRFSSTNQPKRNGRRRRLETILRDDYKLSIDDIRAMMSKGLLSTRSELKTLAEDPATPAYMLAVASGISQLIRKGEMQGLLSAAEFIGKDDKASKPAKYDMSSLSDEALFRIAEIIEDERRKNEQAQ